MRENRIFIFVVLIFIAIGIIIGIKIHINNLEKKLAFTKEDYEYMYNDICNSLGNGEKFYMEEFIEEYIGRTLISIEGKQVTIVGHFDSKENKNIVVYAKYAKDKPEYKNGKAGNVIFIKSDINYLK